MTAARVVSVRFMTMLSKSPWEESVRKLCSASYIICCCWIGTWGVEMNLGHAHNTRFWYLLGVFSKFSDEYSRHFYKGVPPPPGPSIWETKIDSGRRVRNPPIRATMSQRFIHFRTKRGEPSIWETKSCFGWKGNPPNRVGSLFCYGRVTLLHIPFSI